MGIEARYYDLTHGTHGFILLYVIIALFQLAGMRRGRATLDQYFFWPFSSLATMVVVGLSISVLLWLLSAIFGVKFGGIGENLFALIIAMIGAYIGGLYWAARGRPLAAEPGRGAMVLDGQLAQVQTQQLRKQALAKPDTRFPLTVAGVAIPFEDEIKHFKLMGTTGSGKSSSLRELVHAALYRGDRAVIADPDGGYLSRFYNPKRGDVILNPFDARSAKWNLFSELRNAYDVDQLARALIPDRGSADTTWTSYARTFFSAVTRQAQAAGITDIGELYRLLTAAPKEELKLLVDGTPAAPFLEEGSEKLFGGVRSTTTDHVKCLDYIRAQTGTPISVREWVKSGKGVLFLPYQADQIAALKSIISTWMRLAIFQTMSLGEGDRRLWFVVDELDALGAIDGLPDALARLRKFGGRCALGFQSISQVSTTYGHGPAQAMVENCGNTLVLRCSASEGGGTGRFASRFIGEREVTRLTHSFSRSSGSGLSSDRDTHGHSEQHATESAVMAAEIEQLPDRAGFLKFPSQPAWMRVSFAYYDTPKIAEPFIEV
jgi:type IV secretory pathway TraG/TraD family ATPase VirD4